MSTSDTSDRDVSWFRRMPFWIRAVLVGSVALNLLILGSLIGTRFGGHHHGERGLRRVLGHLPSDQRAEVGAILKKHRAGVRPLREKLRADRRAVLDYLKQDNVDAGELESRLAALDAQQLAIKAKLRPMVLELSAKLKPEDRARIVRRLLGDRRGRRGRRGRDRRRYRE